VSRADCGVCAGEAVSLLRKQARRKKIPRNENEDAASEQHDSILAP